MSKIDYWYSISNKAKSTIAQSSNVESTTSALSTTSSLVSEFVASRYAICQILIE
nr:338_t:CDS:2 [Entrophospora candida]